MKPYYKVFPTLVFCL